MKPIRMSRTRRARKYYLTLFSVTLMLSLTALATHGQLPEGKGKGVVQAVCSECHTLKNITDSRRTAEEWHDTVGSMISFGAHLQEDEIDTIVEYLAINFGKASSAGASAKININKATAKELQASLDFSQREAEAVVSYREGNGDFGQLEDLKKVPGLDPKKIEEKKDHIAF